MIYLYLGAAAVLGIVMKFHKTHDKRKMTIKHF